MTNRWKAAIIVALLSVNLVLGAVAMRGTLVNEARADGSSHTEELLPYMSTQQRSMHKLFLSIQAKNKPLAEFYLEKIGETFDIIETKFPTYDNFQIGALSKAMFDPATPPLAKALGASDWAGASAAYNNVVTACNNCHIATQHAFVKIVTPTGNPFNQSFAP